MRERLEIATTAVLVGCALVVTALLGRRELLPRKSDARPQPTLAAGHQHVDWKSFEAVGRRVGPADAPATVLEFVDYECPACRAFSYELDSVIRDVDKTHPHQLATIFVHYPLRMHRFAKLAAHAVECSDFQGHFSSMQQILFSKQDSFGLKPWSTYAAEAGIRDTVRFQNCLKDTASARRVFLGLALAERLNLPATPTVLLNGSQYSIPPQRAVLQADIENILAQARQPAQRSGQQVRRR